MSYRAVIFDLDGVLVFTDRFHYRAWKQLADSKGIYFDGEINNRLRGVSRMESLDIILEGWSGTPFTPSEKDSMAEEKNRVYCKLLQSMTPLDVTDEVRTTLDALRGRGLLLAIGSSSRNTKFILRQTRIGEYFDAVSDGTNITRSKPDPEVFLAAATMLNTAPADCLVVEDAEAGLQAARSAGMGAAAIGDAVRSPLADFRLTTFSDLLTLLP